MAGHTASSRRLCSLTAQNWAPKGREAAAQHRMHALQSRERLQPHAAVAHRQVAAFHERKSEIAREVRMLEVGFIERPGRQQHRKRAPPASRFAARIVDAHQRHRIPVGTPAFAPESTRRLAASPVKAASP